MSGLPNYSALMDTPLGFQSAASPIDSMAAAAPALPEVSFGVGGGFQNNASTGLGFNIGTANAALSGIQSLGALWNSFQANKMAKKQFKFTKAITRANLANQIKAYNTALADRARSRAVMESQTPEQAQAYFDSNSLKQLPGQTSGGFGGGSYTASLGGSAPVGVAPTGTAPRPLPGPAAAPTAGSAGGGGLARFSRLARPRNEDPQG